MHVSPNLVRTYVQASRLSIQFFSKEKTRIGEVNVSSGDGKKTSFPISWKKMRSVQWFGQALRSQRSL